MYRTERDDVQKFFLFGSALHWVNAATKSNAAPSQNCNKCSTGGGSIERSDEAK